MQRQPQSAKQRKNKNQSAMILRGSLPSLRTSSVDILRPKTRDNEAYTFDLQLIPLGFQLGAGGILKQRFQFQVAAVSLLTQLLTVFEEVRFLGVRFSPRVLFGQLTSGSPSGYMKVWLDDAILTTTAPTYTDAFSRQAVDVTLTSSPQTRKQELQWVATDTEDLDWISIPTGSPATFVPFTVCVFAAPGATPSATTGTYTSSTDMYSVVSLDGAARVQLRTLRSA
jgi:hypothetical protein